MPDRRKRRPFHLLHRLSERWVELGRDSSCGDVHRFWTGEVGREGRGEGEDFVEFRGVEPYVVGVGLAVVVVFFVGGEGGNDDGGGGVGKGSAGDGGGEGTAAFDDAEWLDGGFGWFLAVGLFRVGGGGGGVGRR